MMKTRAALLTAPHEPFQIETLDLAPPRRGEVLVKISAAGVCHSDWHLVSGATQHPLPVVAGHEGAGRVQTVGEGVTGIKPGDLVALNWAPNCGDCFYCTHGRPSLCATYVEPIWAGTMMDGTTRLSRNGQPVYHFSGLACFAEFAVVPVESCVPLPQTVPASVAAVLGCAVTTGVGAALNTVQVQPGDRVAVFGAGGVGLSTIMGAQLAGAAQIVAVDVSAEKSAMARAFGATDTVTTDEDVVARIRELTDGRGADIVFEAIGIPTVQEQCLDAVRPGGTLVLVGLSPMGSATNFPSAVIARQEKTIVGSYYGSADTSRDFPLYADWYLNGRLDLDRLISRTYALDQINEAYADMLAGRLARGVILMG